MKESRLHEISYCCAAPKYVDVICKRYAELTKQPVILDSDGRRFEEIAEERLGHDRVGAR